MTETQGRPVVPKWLNHTPVNKPGTDHIQLFIDPHDEFSLTNSKAMQLSINIHTQLLIQALSTSLILLLQTLVQTQTLMVKV